MSGWSLVFNDLKLDLVFYIFIVVSAEPEETRYRILDVIDENMESFGHNQLPKLYSWKHIEKKQLYVGSVPQDSL